MKAPMTAAKASRTVESRTVEPGLSRPQIRTLDELCTSMVVVITEDMSTLSSAKA